MISRSRRPVTKEKVETISPVSYTTYLITMGWGVENVYLHADNYTEHNTVIGHTKFSPDRRPFKKQFRKTKVRSLPDTAYAVEQLVIMNTAKFCGTGGKGLIQ
jgi:hypothetical protein